MSSQEEAARTTAEGRESNGQFAKGNKGGPGNPYARQTALLRQMALECLTPEEMRAIMQKMIGLAKEGDVSAARLVLQYTLGRPIEQPHPDRVDADEFATLQANSIEGATALATMRALPAKPIVDLASVFLPHQAEVFLKQIKDGLQAQTADGKRPQTAKPTPKGVAPDVVLSDTTTLRLVTDTDSKRPQSERAANPPRPESTSTKS